MRIRYTAFQSPLELLKVIERGMNFDVIFLDIIMPGENGFETAKEIRTYDNNVKIIFLTSSTEFAVESYTVGAFFYQLKPIWKDSLFRLMDSVLSECTRTKSNTLVLKCKNGINCINLDELEYCEVIRRTLLLHMVTDKLYECNSSMEEFCNMIKQYNQFLRPHRSYVVNMNYIQSISYREIITTNSICIPIPRGKYADLKDTYLAYAFEHKQVIL